MKSTILYFTTLLFVFSSGCSKSSDSKDPKTGPGSSNQFSSDDLGYNPSTRWQQSGDYSYNFDYTFNGAHCSTNKSFSNLADYCLGLQDQNLNNSCALPLRKDAYRQECGNDFQEINFRSGFWKSGFDNRLQKQCKSTSSPDSVFKTKKQYCQFLKNESLHGNCFWDDRLSLYRDIGCQGAFSQEPPVAIPPVTPSEPIQPNPPVPSQPEDPMNNIPVVKFLRSNGITIKVDWTAIHQIESYPLPGSLPLDQQMDIFWNELENSRNEILARKNLMSVINVTIYTDYYNDRTLSLDYQVKPNTMKGYFPLFDKLLKYSKELQITFGINHSGQISDNISFLPLRSFLAVLEKNMSTLKSMIGTFKEIRTGSVSYYYSKSQSLNLKQDNFESEFQHYIDLLRPISPLFFWANRENIKLTADFDIEQDSAKVYSAFSILQGNLKNFDQMAKVKMLNEITISLFDNGSQNFWSNIKVLSLSIANSNNDLLLKILSALGRQANLSFEIQKPIELSVSQIDIGYLKSVSTLETLWSKIKSKADKISKISLGYESRYYSSLMELTIGYNTSVKETDAIIASIK